MVALHLVFLVHNWSLSLLFRFSKVRRGSFVSEDWRGTCLQSTLAARRCKSRGVVTLGS